MKKKVFILSGPAGAGKNTLWNAIMPLCRDSIEESISTTTRTPIRAGEQHGVDYYFVSKEEFEAKIQSGDFLEYAVTHTFYYGSTYTELERIMKSGKSPIYIIDVKGMKNLKLHLEEHGYEVVTIFLLPPSLEEMKKRLQARGSESDEQYQIRLNTAIEELKLKDIYDYCIINDDLEVAKNELLALLKR